MKIQLNINHPTYRASARDLKFIEHIRDRDVSVLENLQKQKIETLLKFREAKKVVETFQYTLDKYSLSGVPQAIINKARSDLDEMKTFRNVLWNKLKEINLAILAEEEKNY